MSWREKNNRARWNFPNTFRRISSPFRGEKKEQKKDKATGTDERGERQRTTREATRAASSISFTKPKKKAVRVEGTIATRKKRHPHPEVCAKKKAFNRRRADAAARTHRHRRRRPARRRPGPTFRWRRCRGRPALGPGRR